mmetsp:Transcript_17361/g.37706  ORF Transcript_17361/g.37706 Transcript_17361/m.37706 type:complete len:273 (-) Transcript_17361:681-1499(-)
MCLSRLAKPASSNGILGSAYSLGRGAPAATAGAPPCIFNARSVATITAHLGFNPAERHLILKNFSTPMSAPNPASVTTIPSLPTSLRAIWSATTDELPVAMLANGPACTNTGVPSNVCIRFGRSASFMRAVSAPPIPRSSAVTTSSLLLLQEPTTIEPSLRRRSARSVDIARIAMISEATEMSNPVACSTFFSAGPCATVIRRSMRSFTSTTRCTRTVLSSISSRTNLATSSSDKSAGEAFDTKPSFFSLGYMPRANGFPSGHSRLNNAASD